MKSKGVPALIPFLIAIFVLFIGILIWAYIETKKANPQMIQVGQAFREGGTGASACHPRASLGRAGRARPLQRARYRLASPERRSGFSRA